MFSIFQPGNQQRLKSLIGESVDPIDSHEKIQKKLSEGVHLLVSADACKKAGIEEEQRERISKFVVAAVVGVLLLAFLTFSFTPLLFAFLIPIFIKIWLSSKVSKRVESFDKDFAALLLSIASSLRAGVDATSALERSVNLFPKESVMHQELEKFVRNIASGKTEEDSIVAFGEDVDHPDIELFRRSFMLSRKQGGSLSMCLQRLARFTRQRQSFRRKMKAALAMQKLSAFGIAGCAIVIVLMQAVSQTDLFLSALNHSLGFRMLSIGAVLIVIGIVGMLRLSTYKGSESV